MWSKFVNQQELCKVREDVENYVNLEVCALINLEISD